jgi:hypothetical protein
MERIPTTKPEARERAIEVCAHAPTERKNAPGCMATSLTPSPIFDLAGIAPDQPWNGGRAFAASLSIPRNAI